MVRINNHATDVKPMGATTGVDGSDLSARKGGVATPIVSSVDSAQVSAAGGLVVQASAGSDVRTAKVAALQAAIAGGTYNVSASAVADKLIDSLLGAK